MVALNMNTYEVATQVRGHKAVSPPPYPPAPADIRDGAGLARGAVLGEHARTRHK